MFAGSAFTRRLPRRQNLDTPLVSSLKSAALRVDSISVLQQVG